MVIPRIRLKEKEYNYIQNKRLTDYGSFTAFLGSDKHGWLSDLKVQRCINKVIQGNHFDEIADLGDLGDWPYISRHEKKLYGDGILKGYSEVEEARYIREQLLAPLRHSAGNTKISFIPGNHDERITKPNLLSLSQLSRLAVLHEERNATKLQSILDFDKYGISWNGVDDTIEWFDCFTGVHGLSLAKNAPDRNMQQYEGSGASGHTHRLHVKYITGRKNQCVWVEVGCGRLRTAVEYFPTGVIPDWQHGFATVTFYLDNGFPRYFVQSYPIIDNMTVYNGVVYDGNK